MAIDVGALTETVIDRFASTITVARTGVADRSESGVLHLHSEEWSSEGGIELVVSRDTLSVRQSVDIQEDDEITCSDTAVVPTSTTWTVTGRDPTDDDHYLHVWRLKPSDWEAEYFPDTVTVKQINSRDDYGKPDSLGAASTIRCRYKPGGRRFTQSDGQIVESVDMLLAVSEPDSTDTRRGGWYDYLIFPPGANTSNVDEGLEADDVSAVEDPSGDGHLWEVTL